MEEKKCGGRDGDENEEEGGKIVVVMGMVMVMIKRARIEGMSRKGGDGEEREEKDSSRGKSPK